MTCTGTVYSYAQLEGLWINAGGPKAVAPVAAAIAEAESGGCSDALNLTDNNGRQTSVGLWQVSNGTHQYPAAWVTPAGNASEAVAKYKGAGNSFSPWGTYASGAYKPFLNGSTTPDTNVPSSSSSSGGGAAIPPPGSDCAFSLGGVHVPLLFGHGPTVPSTCLIKKSEIRAVLGGGLMLFSAGVALIGAVILAAAAFNRTGALSKAAAAASVVPGGGVVAAPLRRAHSRVSGQ